MGDSASDVPDMLPSNNPTAPFYYQAAPAGAVPTPRASRLKSAPVGWAVASDAGSLPRADKPGFCPAEPTTPGRVSAKRRSAEMSAHCEQSGPPLLAHRGMCRPLSQRGGSVRASQLPQVRCANPKAEIVIMIALTVPALSAAET